MIRRELPGSDSAFPNVSEDGNTVVCGHHVSGQPARAFIIDMVSGRRRVLAERGLRPVWASADVIIYGADPAGIYSISPDEDAEPLKLDNLDYNEVVAGGGRWAGFRQVAGHGTLRKPDGRVVDDAGAPAMNRRGELAWIEGFSSQNPTLMLESAAIFSGPVSTPSLCLSALAWTAEYGRQRRTWAWEPGKAPRECQGGREQQFHPIAIDGLGGPWILAQTETRQLLYPIAAGVAYGSSAPVMGYELPVGDGRPSHAVFTAAGFVVAHSLLDGTLVVHAVSPAEARVNLNHVDHVPVDVGRIDKQLWLGYFKVSGRYGDHVLEATREAGNCAVVQGLPYDWAGESPPDPAAEWQDGVRRAAADLGSLGACIVVTGNEQEIRNARPFRDRVVAVWLSDEEDWSPSRNGDFSVIERKIALARTAMRREWGFRRPVLAYFDFNLGDGWRMPAGADWLAVRGYVDPSHQDSVAAACTAGELLVRDQLRRAPTMPIVLIGQAYDRSGTWRNIESLAALQSIYAAFARSDPRIIGLLWFAYARRGGTKDHPELRAWHEAVYRACRPGRPPIVTFVDRPPDDPGPAPGPAPEPLPVPVPTPQPVPVPVPAPEPEEPMPVPYDEGEIERFAITMNNAYRDAGRPALEGVHADLGSGVWIARYRVNRLTMGPHAAAEQTLHELRLGLGLEVDPSNPFPG